MTRIENLIINGKQNKVLKHGTTTQNIYERLLFGGNCFSTSAMTVRKDILVKLNGFDTREDYCIVEDYDLWLKISRVGKIISIADICGNYCIGDSENISSNIEKLHNNLKNVISDHICKLDPLKYDIDKLLKKHLSRIDYYKGRSYQIRGEREKAIEILANSIREYPYCMKKFISLVFAFLGIKV